MADPKIGIVLVNYNGLEFQNNCIDSINESTYKNFMIIVVDNGSSDGSVEKLKFSYNQVEILEMKCNLGVAEGNNIGIRHALKNNCEYILLLNNDTEIEKNMLKILVEKANPGTLAVPKIYYHGHKNLIWCAGGEINWSKGITVHYGMNKRDSDIYKKEKYIQYAPTCCMLIHRDVFNSIGIMDEKYFMYYDDTDFCVRATNHEFKILYVPEALLWHKVSSSSGGEESLTTIYYTNRNRLYFISKYIEKSFRVVMFFYVSRLIKMVRWIFTNKRMNVKILIKAILDYKNNKLGIMR
jgi:GT2 family glycosyltransferase